MNVEMADILGWLAWCGIVFTAAGAVMFLITAIVALITGTKEIHL